MVDKGGYLEDCRFVHGAQALHVASSPRCYET